MLLSMTGFGKHRVTINHTAYDVSIKCLNSKILDINLRLPTALKDMDIQIRECVKAELFRGKIDIYVNREIQSDEPNAKVNDKTLRGYVNQFDKIGKSLKLTDGWYHAMLLQLPQVLDTTEAKLNKKEEQSFIKCLKFALKDVNSFRKVEGTHLEKEFIKQVKSIEKKRQEIDKLFSMNSRDVKKRLKEKLTNNKVIEYDKNRLEQELIYYLEKLDISEEVMRLGGHLIYFEQTLKNKSSEKGKKLGFISQEMGREINTIGSKASNSKIQKKVVEMKDDLEKIKEQIYNVL